MTFSIQTLDLLNMTMQNSFNHLFYFQQSFIIPLVCWFKLKVVVLWELNALFHTVPVFYKGIVQDNTCVCPSITSVFYGSISKFIVTLTPTWRPRSFALSACFHLMNTSIMGQVYDGSSHNSLCQASFCCNVMSTSSSGLSPWSVPNWWAQQV